MHARSILLLWTLSSIAFAQKVCGPTTIYSPCELTFDLSAEDRKAYPNPYLGVSITAEIRSPRHRTVKLPAFWDGEQMVIRFAPTEAGQWNFRITSNIAKYDNKQGEITGTASESPGFVVSANGHHWMWTETRKAHLWMGSVNLDFFRLPPEPFEKALDALVSGKFNHVEAYAEAFSSPDQPDYSFYRELDKRLLSLNSKGVLLDMILGRTNNSLIEKFPVWQQRERYLRYMVARYAAFNITWQITSAFETYEKGRDVTKELGLLLKTIDPYQHPRSTGAIATSAPLSQDGWIDYITYGDPNDQLGAIEHQLYETPSVSVLTDSAGDDAFRHMLWNTTMNGQYPLADIKGSDSRAMTAWFTFMSGNRYWELEPYFDLDGGRAIALPETEYIVYVEKPSGPIEVRVEKHTYDVRWINPATGDVMPMKEFKGEKFVAETPDRAHDWVLHLSREGRKESMLNSYKFESRAFLMQEVESAASRVPYEIAEPAGEEMSSQKPAKFAAKLKRESRGTRSMTYLWTGEVATEGQGYRVLGTGASGTFHIPKSLLRSGGVLSVRLYGMNANGKLYSLDRIYRVVP